MSAAQKSADLVVIGAGLSGLASALLGVEAGMTVLVLEAKSRPGGRVRSLFDEQSGDFVADLGPTWIWPAFQPVARRWIDRLELETFAQYESGQAILDHGPSRAAQIGFLPGQEGSMRVRGGSQAIVKSLVDRLPRESLLLGSPADTVSLSGAGVRITFGNDGASVLTCRRAIVALPPRIALAQLRWDPELSAPLARALEGMPTWMAAHAKVVVRYEKPFWRDRGLSGRIASRVGPIVEGHDHCGADGSPAAIFGFIGWPHSLRAEAGAELRDQVHDQCMRCFGQGSPSPLSIHIEDWARDSRVTSPLDLAGPMSHPEVGPEILRQGHASGRIWFAASETAQRSPGLIEGAFDAAEQTLARIARL